jgi:hypothetical protein
MVLASVKVSEKETDVIQSPSLGIQSRRLTLQPASRRSELRFIESSDDLIYMSVRSR